MSKMESILEQSAKNIEDIRENLESFLLRHRECEDVNGDVEICHRYLSALDYLALAKMNLDWLQNKLKRML